MWTNVGPEIAIYFPWDIWIVTWVAASLWANRTIKRPGGAREWPYRILEIAGFGTLLVFFWDTGHPQVTGNALTDFMLHPFFTLPESVKWAMVGVAALGFLFCWWARLHLGRLWSGWITKKEGHRIVDSGPYRLVRHPIYTGLLTAAIATAAVKGTGHALVGLALLIVAYWMKARLEERFLRGELGKENYDAYARRVPMLVPFSPV